MKIIEQTEMMEHCLRQMRRNPMSREGFEHYVFLQLLKKCSEEEYKKIAIDYLLIIKEEEQ